MKKFILQITFVISTLLMVANVKAQCPTITCLNDTVVNNDSGLCSAVVNYAAPFVIDSCAIIRDTLFYSGAIHMQLKYLEKEIENRIDMVMDMQEEDYSLLEIHRHYTYEEIKILIEHNFQQFPDKTLIASTYVNSHATIGYVIRAIGEIQELHKLHLSMTIEIHDDKMALRIKNLDKHRGNAGLWP